MKVSVITAVYNGKETIATCIDSVLNQDYPDVEHIIVDAGSTDGTLEYLDSIGAEYISEPDLGIYDGFNKGITRADGDILHILNCDDFYAENSVISNVVSKMVAEKLDLCHGIVEQISVDGKPVWQIGRNVNRQQLLYKMCVGHPSVFVRKDVYDNYGNFNTKFKIAADHEFLLRIWSEVSVGFINAVLVKMRIDGVSNSNVAGSFRESALVTLSHGGNYLRTQLLLYWYIFKAKVLISSVRKWGYKKKIKT